MLSIVPIIFSSGKTESRLESIVCEAKRSAVTATLTRLSNLGEMGRPIVATDDALLLELATREGAEGLPTGAEFHFGKTLAAIANRYPNEQILYIGGGSAALMSEDDWRYFLNLIGDNAGVVANNLFSADFVLFGPAEAMKRIEPPIIDNDLGFRLARAGLPASHPDRTTANQFDIDTVVDAVIATYHPNCPPAIRHLIDRSNLDIPGIQAIKAIVIDPAKELLVSGRIGAAVWRVMETETACRKRVFSEERGMRASGRQDAGLTRSILGILLEAFGPDGLLERLSELADGAVIDTRVLMAHMAWRPSTADRMASDLLDVSHIKHAQLRSLTNEILRSGWPVLLGGHNVISAGLWTLAENAWKENDAAQLRSAGRS